MAGEKLVTQVPLLDLRAQYDTLRREILTAVEDVLASGAYVLGPAVTALEEEIAAYCGTRHAVGVASGTDALMLPLMALGVGPGDEIVMPTYTFFATAGVVHRLGATPVLVDIDPIHYNIDPAALESRITDRTRAVIPVHLFGQCADMTSVLEICEARNIPVIEDAAQAIGARHGDRLAGSMGAVGCFSFYPTKNLGGYGDGGMITTDSGEMAERLRRLRAHGAHPKYHHSVVGTNSRLDSLQAAMLRVKLPHLDAWAGKRREHAEFYRRRFEGTGVVTPSEAAGSFHVYNQFVIRVPDRDRMVGALKEEGIGTEIYYPVPMHLQECFAYLGHREGDLPVAEKAARETLAIPVYPELNVDQMERVVDAILRQL